MTIDKSSSFGLLRRLVYEAQDPNWRGKPPRGVTEAEHILAGVSSSEDGQRLRTLHRALGQFDDAELQVMEMKLEKPKQERLTLESMDNRVAA